MFSIWVMTTVAVTAERLGGIVVLVQFMGSFIMWSVGTMRISIALISAPKLTIIFNNVSVFLIFFMTIACLCHVRMTTAMVKTRTKVAETTGSQVVITEAGKEMTVLTIINNLRKICASLFITDNLQGNHVAWRQNDREKSRDNTDGQQNRRNNDRDEQSDMWRCPLHLIITIGDSGNDCCAVCNCLLHLIIYIGDGGGSIRHL